MAFVMSLVQRFQKRLPKDVGEIEQHIAAGDMERTRFVAHSIKGAAAYVGADRMRDIAYRLETSSRNGDLSHSQEDLAEMKAEMQRCLNAAPADVTATAGPCANESVRRAT